MVRGENLNMKIIDTDLLKTLPLPVWNDDADKSTRGKLLLIGGSKRIPGAAILAARAALRVGCGSVRVAAPESVALQIGVAVPELMVVPLGETRDGTLSQSAIEIVAAQCKLCQALILGPGLDENAETDEAAREIVRSAPLPLVVDAQAISALGNNFDFKGTRAPRILTPHAGEFETLWGKKLPDDDEKRAKIASDFAVKNGIVLVLKGRHTFITSPEGEIWKNESGSRALGTAGSGDVLAGIIGGLLAQGLGAAPAAIWGVYFHAQAGEAVSKDGGDDGALASDFVARLPGVQKFLRAQTEVKTQKSFGLRPG